MTNPYIDLTYYKTTYSGYADVTDAEITKAISRSSDLVDIQTGFTIESQTLEIWQESLVKKATAAQTEDYLINGESFNESGSGSESIGKYSYSGGGDSGKDKLSSRAKSFLCQSNLMNRSVYKITHYPEDCCE